VTALLRATRRRVSASPAPGLVKRWPSAAKGAWVEDPPDKSMQPSGQAATQSAGPLTLGR
jgi:hypothetical protein